VASEQLVKVKLEDGTIFVAEATSLGGSLIGERDIVTNLGSVTRSIEKVSREVFDSLKRIAPTKATVELSFSLALQEGNLVALLGKGKAEGTITATLEWTNPTPAVKG
jgi:hypothetical protein